MSKDKRSFFERLTGTVKVERDEDDMDYRGPERHISVNPRDLNREREVHQGEWIEESVEEGQLTVDVYQTPNDIVIKTIVAGVRPEDLDISISRDMVTIRGKREERHEASDEDFFHRELYWGSFSRTVLLPEEIDTEASEASESHGLLTIKLPKIDKRRQMKLKVRSS
ncbi:Hsp20/alpha crystallin family protein [Candidatus Parcubacteria bacterium]|nr:Hsp20/alpha crystallin family protein [Candidatus Parcubacteria bacterium]